MISRSLRKRKVLMFGWEFPPIITGGLGTACSGLTKSMAKKGENITFVIPYSPELHTHVKLIGANQTKYTENITTLQVQSTLKPYTDEKQYQRQVQQVVRTMGQPMPAKQIYGDTLYDEVWRYSEVANQIALDQDHDIIHVHDWLTYLAGIKAKQKTGKPLVAHIHNTVFDRTGGHGISEWEYTIEKQGFEHADRIVAVSEYTKNMVVSKYGIDPKKISVVHNGVEPDEHHPATINPHESLPRGEKMVLFLGRITLQKGPEYLLYAAKRVLEKEPDARFIYAGSGDMEPFIIEKAAELGLSKNVLFAGFLKGKQLAQMYQKADVYVMPSVSEPFGITPLESLKNGTPVIISKQSGVSEVLQHALKVDFWDTEELANKICAVLKYAPLQQELAFNGNREAHEQTWDKAADKIITIYDEVEAAASAMHATGSRIPEREKEV